MLMLRLILIVFGIGFLLWLYRYMRSHPKEVDDKHSPTDSRSESMLSDTGEDMRESTTSESAPQRDRSDLLDPVRESRVKDDRQQRILSLSLRFSDEGLELGDLKKNLEKVGITLGTDSIYHHVNASGKVSFSVANLYEPGYLSPLPLDTIIYGVVLFFRDYPGEQASDRLDRMLGSAHELAQLVGGRLEDSSHHPLTAARTLQLKMVASGATRV